MIVTATKHILPPLSIILSRIVRVAGHADFYRNTKLKANNWNNYSNSTVLMHLPKVPYFSRMESKVACLLLIKRTYYEYDATSVYMMVPMSRRYASKIFGIIYYAKMSYPIRTKI